MRKYILSFVFLGCFFVPLALQAANQWANGFLRDSTGALVVTCRVTPNPSDKKANGFIRDTSGAITINNCTSQGTPVPTPTAAPTGTSTPNNPGVVVQTVDYGWGYNGISATVSIATQSRWLRMAYQGAYNSTYQANGIKTITYTNFNLCYPSDNPRTCWYELAPLSVCQADASGSSPTWPAYSAANCTAKYVSQAAQNCSGTYVYDPHYGNGYLNAPYISTTNYANVAHDRTGIVTENYVFSDDTGSNNGLANGPPCNNSTTYTASLWPGQMQTANAAVTASVIGAPMFVNLLNAYVVGLLPTDLAPIAQASTVVGAMCENCFIKDGGVYDTTGDWVNDQNACLLVISYGKICWVYSNLANVTAAGTNNQRLYAYASFLLSYNNPFSMFQYAISGLSDTFRVLPEEELVPLNAVESPGTIADLASGVGYLRHWNDCFYNGNDLGPCEVAVNPATSGNMTVPTSGYTHSMSIPAGTSTSDIAAGGTVSLTGAVSSSIGPQTAEILLP